MLADAADEGAASDVCNDDQQINRMSQDPPSKDGATPRDRH